MIDTDHEKIKELTAGENHIFIIKEKHIFGLGKNSYNELSNKDKYSFEEPKIVPFSPKL